ncbi:hypothetical protein Lser_V15G15323 [Lactuca serriola]
MGPDSCSVMSKLLKDEDTEAWGLEPYDLDESGAKSKSLTRKWIVRVADGFVILSRYPGQRKVKVAEMSKFGRPKMMLFERGLAYDGIDYLSFSLWDKYIEYEHQLQKWSNLAMIYTCILEIPNQQLDRYFNSFRELAASHPLSELRTIEELEAAARAKGEFKNQESEGEIHPNDGLAEAKELETYISLREELYKKN